MFEKPIYEELEQRLKELENITSENKHLDTQSLSGENMEPFPVKIYIWPVHRWLPEIQ